MSDQNTGWWNPALNEFANQLSKGILNEMKKRILNSNIKKEKLELAENSERMKDFLEERLSDPKDGKRTSWQIREE